MAGQRKDLPFEVLQSVVVRSPRPMVARSSLLGLTAVPRHISWHIALAHAHLLEIEPQIKLDDLESDEALRYLAQRNLIVLDSSGLFRATSRGLDFVSGAGRFADPHLNQDIARFVANVVETRVPIHGIGARESSAEDGRFAPVLPPSAAFQPMVSPMTAHSAAASEDSPASPLSEKHAKSDGDGNGGDGGDGDGDSSRAGDVYALIDVPRVARVGESFAVTIGITDQKRDSNDDPLSVPKGPYVMMVYVAAPKFRLGTRERWANELLVTADNPLPKFTLHLEALTIEASRDREARRISVIYVVDSNVVGFGSADVEVFARNLSALEEREAQSSPVITTSIDTNATPDLTILIDYADPSANKLTWLFISPHFATPEKSDETYVGGAEVFARRLSEEIKPGESGHDADILGVARQVKDSMPNTFATVWSKLVVASGGKPPTVLILSAEPYVPWEHAYVDETIDAHAPPILSAQANITRWILSGKERPKHPPPLRDMPLTPMVAVAAQYRSWKWPALKEAVAEVRYLEKTFGAQRIAALVSPILDCLRGNPGARVLHFALHGTYGDLAPAGGLIMGDESILNDRKVDAYDAPLAPFVFLNACQVGNGSRVLSNYGGLSAAFVRAGARGVISSLWAVNSEDARRFAVDFYDEVSKGKTPAEFLRERRRDLNAPSSTTNFAYICFGSPSLRHDPNSVTDSAIART